MTSTELAPLLRVGTTLRATGHMSTRYGQRIIAGRDLDVVAVQTGVFTLRDRVTGEDYHLTAPEINRGAGPKNRFQVA